jgi:multidrug efflux pump subunit AcrB
MGGITAFSLNTSRVTISFLVLVILAGIMQFLTFPRQEDPPIVIREAVVSAAFPGMLPEQVEDLITRRIEEQIRTMPEIDEITSDSKTGVTIVHATTRDEYSDLDEIWNRLRNKMSDLAPDLPDGTIGPFVNDEFGLVSIATIALWSDGFSMAEMRLVARDIRDRLYELDGIRKVELYGVQDERVTLKFSNAKLSQFGVSPGEVIDTLISQNIILPGGSVNADGREVVLSPSGNFTSVDDIEETLISVPGTNSMVRLSDLLSIERGYIDPPQTLAYYDGQPAIVISVSITPGVNSVEFGERLTRKVRELEGELPIGYVLDFATFQPDLVVAAVDGALSSVYQTLAIVLVVVMLFLGMRSGLIVGSFVPITLLFGLVVMRQFGIELERVSIISSIVALGMLVDNAIVVVEDIRSRLERGQERLEACKESGRTLAVPLLTSSLTTILAFLPMLLVDGQTGDYVFSLPMVVIILLLGSWFMSMYVTPAMAFWFIRVKPHAPAEANGGGAENAVDAEGEETGAGEEPPSDPYDTGFYRIYRGLLEAALAARLFVVALVIGLLVGAGFMSSQLVREFFGPSDRNQFLIYVDQPAGARITATDQSVRDLTEWLGDEEINPEITRNIAYVGTGGPRFFLTLSPVDPDPHVAFLIVNTETDDQVPEVVKRVRQHLLENFPGVNARVKRMWLGSNEPAFVEFRLIGTDSDYLWQKSQELTDAMWATEGIDYVQNDWENKVARVDVVVDQARARRAGVTSQEVALSVNAFLDGASLTDYREGDVAIPVVLQAVDDEREALGDLWNINVYSAQRGVNVPLTQIADFRGRWQFSRIARKDQERTITVSARHQFLKAPQLVARMKDTLDGLDLKPGTRWEIGGEIEDATETNEKLFASMPQCLLAIVLLLVWQFNSFRRPGIIILTIPMAFAGALFGVFVLRAPFDFFAILGMLSLAGVIINNGIVLIDRIDSARAEGLEPYDAVIMAAVSRFRPILMSAITTILGVAPLIIVRDPLFYSMAVVIAAGLALGTLLTLVVVPVLYSLFFRVRRA